MPATAGRVRMPANNRVHSSAALQTHGIWQSAIGYDPYAPNKDDSNKASQVNKTSNSEPDAENAYASFQGLLALARITGSNADEARGSCKKCGRVGHLTFQCRNFLSLKEEKEKDPLALVASGLDKLKENGAKMDNKAVVESSEESSEEEESNDSDSEVDSEIERIIAARSGKKNGGKIKASSNKRRTSDSDESDSGDKKKRGRSTKRRSKKKAASDSDEVDRKRRRDRSRRSSESSKVDDERRHRHRKSRKEKKRRRSHKHSDDSDSSEESDRHHRRRSRRAASRSDSDVSSSDDSRVGRGMKRSEKRKRRYLEEKV